MKPFWLLSFVLSASAVFAAFGFTTADRKADACCQCLVDQGCTDVATDTCVSILQTPVEEEGGTPWRYHSLLGGFDDATACASSTIFTDFDEARAGCGQVCGKFATSTNDGD